MAVLYIRSRSDARYVNVVHDTDEFRDFIDSYLPDYPTIVGDYATFNDTMRLMLLKFVEDNPDVGLYSSEDIQDPILLSRFPQIEKAPLELRPFTDDEAWSSAKRDYVNAIGLQGDCRTDVLLRLPLINRRFDDLLKSV